MECLWLVIYPEFGPFPEAERKKMLRRANLRGFDGIGPASVASGMIAATVLTRFAGPFLIRRTRRGLEPNPRRHPYQREAHS